MKVIFIGVIVGSTGRDAIAPFLNEIKKDGREPDLVIANANNAAGGLGLTKDAATSLFDDGVDVITMGENVWDQKELQTYIDKQPDILRPYNLPEISPGSGILIREVGKNGTKVGIINISGYAFIRRVLPDNPFPMIYGVINDIKGKTPVIIVDFFSIPSAEKVAMKIHLDGRISIFAGTGTLVQSADEKVSRLGTASITDVGMVGAFDSVCGFEKEVEIKRFKTSMKSFPKPAKGQALINAIYSEIDDTTGEARSIERIYRLF